jgi:hypothetical protein
MNVRSCFIWKRRGRIRTQREGDKDGLESWVKLLDESGKEPGEDDRLAVEGSKNVTGKVAQVLASLNVALLDGGDLGVGGRDGGSDAVDVGNDGLGGNALLVVSSVGRDRLGGLGHVGGESLDLDVEVDEPVSEHRASSALLNGGDLRNR